MAMSVYPKKYDSTNSDLLTQKERAQMNKRAAIADALARGLTYREISDALGVSTSSIALVSRLIGGKK